MTNLKVSLYIFVSCDEINQLLLEFDDLTALTASIQMWVCIYYYKQGEPEELIFLLDIHHSLK